jgi:hypothetical protein
MYRSDSHNQCSLFSYSLSKLDQSNRWIKLAALVPWGVLEKGYSGQFSQQGGNPSLSFRVALGSLLIQQLLGATDRETVKQIGENPYLQYLIGYVDFEQEAPFHPSMLTHFRKRISEDLLTEINNLLITLGGNKIPLKDQSYIECSESVVVENRGKLILDATCVPADIRYPTDVSLLNESREHLEGIIDTLIEQPSCEYGTSKPRTYRRIARRKYREFSLKKKPSSKNIRRAKREQLQFVRRNLGIIDTLLDCGATLSALPPRLYRTLLVVREVFRQQQQMYQQKCHRIEGRIVSISQPHVRPIVRGKAGTPVEFGAKVSASYNEGLVSFDRISFDPYNEATDLPQQVEAYKNRFGVYPASLHVDKIYRTRANRDYCEQRGIRLSGPPLGRPKKDEKAQKTEKKQQRDDANYRSRIEGIFGNGKRRLSLNRVLTKLSSTTTTVIALSAIALNLLHLLGTF